MKNVCVRLCFWILLFSSAPFSKEVSPVTSVPALSPKIQLVTYKTAISMRTREKRSVLILWISLKPEDFVRDRMVMLARQLNQDFSNEQRIYAVFFDSEEAVRSYNPVSGTYEMSKKLERGEYNLDRAKGRESIIFSSRRGKRIDEIKVTLSSRLTPKKKLKR